MQLTQQTDYALRMLMHLSVHPGEDWVPVGQIAESLQLSSHHLLKVARRLAEHGWLETRRGVSGGVRLAIDPGELRIGEVVRRIEPNMALVDCLRDPPRACTLVPACALRHKLSDALEAFLAVLDELSLSDCVSDPGSLRS